jgi:single-strand DNA-binding protein
MSDLNKVILIGRLVRDAEGKTTNSGLYVATFSIATRNVKRNADGDFEEAPHFFNFALYGKRAEALAPYLLKGQQVAIDGYLEQNRWEKDGKKQSAVRTVIRNIQLLGSKPKDGGGGTEVEGETDFSADFAGMEED